MLTSAIVCGAAGSAAISGSAGISGSAQLVIATATNRAIKIGLYWINILIIWALIIFFMFYLFNLTWKTFLFLKLFCLLLFDDQLIMSESLKLISLYSGSVF